MQKQPEITFKDVERSEALEGFIVEKIEQMERRHQRITTCRIAVSAPHRSPAEGRPALAIAVEVDVPGHKLIAAKDAERPDELGGNRTAMVNRAFQAAERQLQAAAETMRNDVKHHEGAADTGQIRRLFPEQDYGFVEVQGSPELYFSRNAVADERFDELRPGTLVQVTRAAAEGPMGPQASMVRLLNARRSPSG